MRAGCRHIFLWKKLKKKPINRLESVVIRDVGGTIKAVEIAARYATQMSRDASKLVKEDIDISELIMATECGGSDPTSGLAANPVVGEIQATVLLILGRLLF